MFDKKVIAAKSEVQRLLDTSFLWEVQYPTWLVNVVMVKKKNNKWRMYTYFTDLNNCCPKDDFLLSGIDKVVDSAANCETIALLHCFSSYHQIYLHKKDEEKQALLRPLALTITSKCQKVSRMSIPFSVE
jgi:hypothetical protein